MSKRKPSKFRRAKREQRARAKAITVDIENEAMRIGRDMHKMLIEGHFHEYKGHSKNVLDQGRLVEGSSYDQLKMYAGAAGLDEVVIMTGGDFIHEPVLHTDLVPYDLTKINKIMRDYNETIRHAMSPGSYKPDPRLDPITGRVRPVFDEDSE